MAKKLGRPKNVTPNPQAPTRALPEETPSPSPAEEVIAPPAASPTASVPKLDLSRPPLENEIAVKRLESQGYDPAQVMESGWNKSEQRAVFLMLNGPQINIGVADLFQGNN